MGEVLDCWAFHTVYDGVWVLYKKIDSAGVMGMVWLTVNVSGKRTNCLLISIIV